MGDGPAEQQEVSLADKLFTYSHDTAPPASDCPVFLPGWGFDGRVAGLAPSKRGWLAGAVPAAPNEILAGLEQAVRHYGLNSVAITGWSLGAYLALDFARLHPGLVTAIYLLAPRHHWPKAEIDEVRRGLADDREAFLRSFYRKCFLGYRAAYEAFREDLEPAYLSNAGAQGVLEKGLAYLEDIRLADRLDGLSPEIPVYLLLGAKDLVAPLPPVPLPARCFARVIKHAGHALFLEESFNPDQHRRKALIRRKFSRAAATYDEHATVQRQAVERLALELPAVSPKTVLELGCGTGNYTALLAERYPESRIDAVDFSEAMIGVAANKVRRSNVTFVCRDAEAFLQENRLRFDLITSNATMQWFDDLERAAGLMGRGLEDGGVLLATVFGRESLKELREGLAAVNPGGVTMPVDNFHDETGLEKIFTDHFRDVSVIEWQMARYYPTITDLLRHIHRTGTAGPGAGQALLDRRRLAALEQWFLENLGECRISYQVFMVKCRRSRERAKTP